MFYNISNQRTKQVSASLQNLGNYNQIYVWAKG